MRISVICAATAAVFALSVAGASFAEEKAAASQPASAPAAAPAAAGKASAKPAKNGITVKEVYAKKAELNAKSVTVTGKVVKYNAGIMGKTWIHIQDGTGAKSAGTNDLTVTTLGGEGIKVGDTITATGTLAADKDFGGGYRYAVIVEDAKVTKK